MKWVAHRSWKAAGPRILMPSSAADCTLLRHRCDMSGFGKQDVRSFIIQPAAGQTAGEMLQRP